jgi:hypothetical protein
MSQGFGSIKRLTRNEISEEKWDLLCKKLDYPIFNSTWYLDSVCENWSAFVLNDYELALPVFPKKKFGVNYSLQPLFVRSISLMGENIENKNKFLVDILKEYDFFVLNFDIKNLDLSNLFDYIQNKFQILFFKESYELTRASYSQNAKRKLNQFEKYNTSIICSNNTNDLIEIFKREKGGNFQNMNEASYDKLKNIMTSALLKNFGNVYSVELNGEILAIGFFVEFGHHLLYLKGAVTKNGKEFGAMYGLFDHVIKKFHSSHRWLDFGGSSDTGVAGFNKKFGASDMNYLILKNNKLPWPLNLIAKSKLGI